MTPFSYITPGHVRAFQAITSRLYDNIMLWSCIVNGEPGVAIVMIDQVTDHQLAIMPLFVAITDGMKLVFPDRDGSGDDGGGGPQRPAERAFEANKTALTPGGAS
jgi:hypothetical protein